MQTITVCNMNNNNEKNSNNNEKNSNRITNISNNNTINHLKKGAVSAAAAVSEQIFFGSFRYVKT